jgi:hypothetical protein
MKLTSVQIARIMSSIEKDIVKEAKASIDFTHESEEMMYICLSHFQDRLLKYKENINPHPPH